MHGTFVWNELATSDVEKAKAFGRPHDRLSFPRSGQERCGACHIPNRATTFGPQLCQEQETQAT